MKTLWTGHVVGTFYGYQGSRVYTLSDGSKWIQADHTEDPVCNESPSAWLLCNAPGRVYLRVEGMSAAVSVVQPEGKLLTAETFTVHAHL
jgi:hypothetical protein